MTKCRPVHEGALAGHPKRKAGELLAGMEMKPGPKGNGSIALPSLGITKIQSSRWQRAAAQRRREIVAGQAKERQVRKPADSVVENLPPQTDKTRDAIAAEIGRPTSTGWR